MKAKVGELDNENREVFSRNMNKYLTVLMESVSGKRGLLERFQYFCEKYPTSNKITFVTVDRIPVPEESKVSINYKILKSLLICRKYTIIVFMFY